jgi:hypothetical protein
MMYVIYTMTLLTSKPSFPTAGGRHVRQAAFATISILQIFHPTLDGVTFPEEWMEIPFLTREWESGRSIEQRGFECLTMPVFVKVPSRIEN